MAINIDYKIASHGWATFALIDGEHRFTGESGEMLNPLAALAHWAVEWSTGFRIAHVGLRLNLGSVSVE